MAQEFSGDRPSSTPSPCASRCAAPTAACPTPSPGRTACRSTRRSSRPRARLPQGPHRLRGRALRVHPLVAGRGARPHRQGRLLGRPGVHRDVELRAGSPAARPRSTPSPTASCMAFLFAQKVIEPGREAGNEGLLGHLRRPTAACCSTTAPGHQPTADLRVRQAVASPSTRSSSTSGCWTGRACRRRAHQRRPAHLRRDRRARRRPRQGPSLVAEAKAEGWDGKLNLACPATWAPRSRRHHREGPAHRVGFNRGAREPAVGPAEPGRSSSTYNYDAGHRRLLHLRRRPRRAASTSS